MFHILFDGPKPLFHIQYMLFGSEKLFIDGAASVDILILGQVSDVFVPGDHYRTGICRKFLHNDTQKGGFSCSVASDQSCFFPLFYMKRRVI